MTCDLFLPENPQLPRPAQAWRGVFLRFMLDINPWYVPAGQIQEVVDMGLFSRPKMPALPPAASELPAMPPPIPQTNPAMSRRDPSRANAQMAAGFGMNNTILTGPQGLRPQTGDLLQRGKSLLGA